MNLPAVDSLLIRANASIREALTLIDRNAQGVVFVVNESGSLVGVMTDGDIRRAMLKGAALGDKILNFMNPNFVSRPVDASPKEVLSLLEVKGIHHIPLVDLNNKPVDYACMGRLHRIPVMEPLLDGNELAYVTDCIKSNWISSQGKYVRKFEEVFSAFHESPHALAVSNGTVGLHLALIALGIGPGDEVIVPDFTFAASINSIIHAGATPVIVDIEEETWTVDPACIVSAITPRTKAIMPVHIYGHPCKMDELNTIAKRYSLLVIEDCAEALGSRFNGELVGTFGEAAVFSFFGNKTITTGEGGMVLFKDSKYAERALRLRDHGMSKEKRYWHDEVGFNFRMTNLQAAIGVAQMERVESILKIKRNLGQRYTEEFGEIEGLIPAPEANWATNSYWLYTALVSDACSMSRDELIDKLLQNGIETRPAFYPLHAMPPYSKYLRSFDFPNTTSISLRGISLPSSVSLTASEVESVVGSIRSVMEVRSSLVDVL